MRASPPQNRTLPVQIQSVRVHAGTLQHPGCVSSLLTRNESLENIPFAAPVMFHSLAMNERGGARQDTRHVGTRFFDTAYFDHVHDQIFYRRLSYFPLHGPISVCEYTFEPAFIQKRNERERHRVRCVNDGYARLREHLPHEFEDKRLSKVETLRAAIDYIKHLQSLLVLKTGVAAPAQTDRAEAEKRTNEGKHLQSMEAFTKPFIRDDEKES